MQNPESSPVIRESSSESTKGLCWEGFVKGYISDVADTTYIKPTTQSGADLRQKASSATSPERSPPPPFSSLPSSVRITKMLMGGRVRERSDRKKFFPVRPGGGRKSYKLIVWL